ncbi:dihydroorotate oxidase [Pavlovales sp. CCMP2436]|nr:dihydroorotate oxidase [Pavlovales sp. CCMP2436]
MSRRVALVGTGVGVACGAYYTYSRTRRGELYGLIKPVLDQMDAERVHRIGVEIAGRPWLVRLLGFADDARDAPCLRSVVWGVEFANPIGLAAGYDKNGESIAGLATMGFGFVEVGSVTPQPQAGNPKPRVFRLLEDRAVINRYGFNSDGMEAVAQRTEAWHAARDTGFAPGGKSCVLGINLGKNKSTEDAAADYEAAMARLGGAADYIVVNVSSPNTPGLRALQARSELEALLTRMVKARDALPPLKLSAHSPVGQGPGAPPNGKRPLLLKIAPDLSDGELRDIAAVALTLKIDGLIVSNTMTERPPTLKSANFAETGGLSGQPLFDKSTAVLSKMYALTDGKVPLIGVGGVSDASQAYAKIRAGASLVQLYTGFAYEGPSLVRSLKVGLVERLAKDGFKSVAEAVGADHRKK